MSEEHLHFTVQEKIIIEKQYVGYPPKPVGPSVRLLFNELNHNVSLPSRIIDKAAAVCLLALFILLLPFITVAIKLSSSGPVLIKQTCTGYRGLLFERYLFRTTSYQPDLYVDSDPEIRTFSFGKFLKFIRLDELPSVLNILRGEMKLVGPKARPALTDNYWNNQYSEYYKRFAVKPGLIGVSPIRSRNHLTADEVRRLLKKEFKYLLTPNLLTELNILAQRFVPIIKQGQIADKLRM